MFAPFQLKQAIGEAHTMDLGDSLNTKRALARLGYLAVPDGGLDEYPDRSMLEAVKSFQRDQGLAVDGVMKPDGPTLNRMNEILDTQEKTTPQPSDSNTAGPPSAPPHPSLFQPINLSRPITPSTSVDLGDTARVKSAFHLLGLPQPEDDGPYPTADLFKNIRAFQGREGLRVDGEMLPGGETEARMNALMQAQAKASELRAGGTADPKTSGRNGATNTQVAQAAAVEKVFSLLGLLGVSGGVVGKKLLDDLQKKDETPSNPDTSDRMTPAPVEPPLPGIEPPNVKLPDRTESPSAVVELPDLSNPLPVQEKPTIYVLPALEPDEFGNGIVERKGNEATRKELERIRNYFREAGWKHIAGGRYAPDDPEVVAGVRKAGQERKERHVPGHFGGLKGGHFTDLTFKDGRGRILHVQSVDVDKNGKPTQRELDNAEKIRRAEGNEGRDVYILLIPKGAQLKHYRQ